MTENKRYFVEKHFLKKNKVRDTIYSISRNIDETVEHMNILYNKYVSLKEENEQLKALIKKTLETTPIEHTLAVELKNSVRELYD